MKVFITGDTHGLVAERIDKLLKSNPNLIPEETALVILGDVGLNYYLNQKDQKNKKKVEKKGVYVYAVRGNHEARPSCVPNMKLIHDDFVNGAVWIEEKFPHIRYFCDWGIYNIQGLQTLVVGGAYSVDKLYRLNYDMQWFANEQLTNYEMTACSKNTKGRTFDLVLAHTCPKSWQPTDLFFADQTFVDDTMEKWLDKLVAAMNWKLFLFGHYHGDRIELPYVELFYKSIKPLNDILERWDKYKKTGELDWYLSVSPKMEKLMDKN